MVCAQLVYMHMVAPPVRSVQAWSRRSSNSWGMEWTRVKAERKAKVIVIFMVILRAGF